MKIGMVGLGRMGTGLCRRLRVHGHAAVVYDRDQAAVAELSREGFEAASTVEDLVARLDPPRAVWIMVPAAAVESAIDELARHVDAGDILIDGGNTYFVDDLDRAERLGTAGIRYVDVGTSGGVHGSSRGFCLMIGGDPDTVDELIPIFRALAPGVDSNERTAGLTGEAAPGEEGWLHCGPVGAGHFVKMVHNGIEYGMMAAIAEGLNILHHADAGNAERRADAETSPLRDPERFRFDIDVAAVAEVWRRGSVVSSWLVDLTASALSSDPALERFEGHVSDSGEGRWTVASAVETGVPAPVLSAALYSRFASRGNADFASRVLSAMRSEFGGHDEHPS